MTGPQCATGACALALLAACDLPPPGVVPADMEAYQIAVVSIGCALVGESDYLPVELQAGLSRQQVLDITSHYLATGRAQRLPGGGVELTTGACA